MSFSAAFKLRDLRPIKFIQLREKNCKSMISPVSLIVYVDKDYS